MTCQDHWQYSLTSAKNRILAWRVNGLRDICFTASRNAGWWPTKTVNLGANPPSPENVGTTPEENPLVFSNKLMLIVSELAEAMEGDRKDSMDAHLPHRKAREVELADALIRIFDLAGAYEMDIGGAMAEKLEYNETRADHSKEARAATGGKKY